MKEKLSSMWLILYGEMIACLSCSLLSYFQCLILGYVSLVFVVLYNSHAYYCVIYIYPWACLV